jgi:hypothetical protein
MGVGMALLCSAPLGVALSRDKSGSPYYQPSGIITTASTSAEGTITQVDVTRRTVTVATYDGRIVQGSVNPSVGGLELVKVGDRVAAKYEEKLIFSVAPPNAQTPADRFDSIAVTSQDKELPAGVIALEGTKTWTIVEANPSASTIALVDSRGGAVRTYDVRSAEGRARLAQVKPGDKLTITFASYVFGVVTRAP